MCRARCPSAGGALPSALSAGRGAGGSMMGQHIRILKGGRWIHAVDCGDETVLHLAEEAPPPRVRRAYRPEFVAGADAVEVVTHRERTYPASEIVRRAYSRASDPALAAMFQDSEAFAEWCTT